jgi:hypothetical protein
LSEQVVAVSLERTRQLYLSGICHLKKQQICQLLDIVAITHPVIAEDVAVAPGF